MKRKSIFFISVLAMLMMVVTACDDSSNEAGSNGGEEDITLEFWTMQLEPTFTDYLEDLIDKYEEENPNVTIDWLDVPASDLEEKVLADVSAGNAPDVVNLNPAFGASLADLGATTNMDELVPDEEKEKYLEGAWEASQLDGETYAIPWYLTTEVNQNNAALYEEAGLDVEDPPETYEEAAEYAKIIKEETGKYGFFPSMDLSLPLKYMAKMDVELMNDDGTAAFNNEKGIEVIELFTELYEEKAIPAEALSGDQDEGADLYQSGEVAIGGFSIESIKENAPDIYDETVVSGALTGDSGNIDISVLNLVVPEPSEHHEAAVDFALFVTNSENQINFAKETPVLPSIEKALDDPYFTDEPDDADPIEMERIISAEQLDNAELLVPPMENSSDLETVMHDAFARAMLGEQTPEESLDEAEKEWNDIVNK